MDEAKARFLFGEVSSGMDLDDADVRALLFEEADPAEERPAWAALQSVIANLIEDGGPLVLLAGDRMVHVGDLIAGVVMTHRLSDAEAQLGMIEGTFDLAAFGRLDNLTLPDGTPIDIYEEESGDLGWGGPEGWLGALRPGDLLAVRASDAGVVSISAIPASEE